MKLYTAILSFAALATQVQSDNVPSCAEQNGCFTWEVNTLCGSEIQCTDLEGCVVEICMSINTSLESCVKNGESISHACDASDTLGCAYSDDTSNPLFDVGNYGTCPEVIGRANTTAGSAKCDNITETKFCQEALPGQTVYFILKDANIDIDENNLPFPDTDNWGDNCGATVTCSNNNYTCGEKLNTAQQPYERVWAYTVPLEPDCHSCSCPDPTPSPTSGATQERAPAAGPGPGKPSPSGTQGDPHFKTWQNEHFEYHGQCDMVLVKDQEFADGLGLDVQIRTKLIRFWSYIKQAAIRIGDDILEIEGSADPEADASFWMNLEYQGKLETLGGFPVTYYRKGTLGKWFYEIDLNSKFPNHKIVISTYKEFVRVDFENASEEAFGNSKGVLGDFRSGATLARDGFTILDDFTELGNEWQILPIDNMLFHDISEPQFPRKCIEPEDPRGERRRRLEESIVSEKQAEQACASIKDPLDKKDCVYDIIATQDLDMVGAY